MTTALIEFGGYVVEGGVAYRVIEGRGVPTLVGDQHCDYADVHLEDAWSEITEPGVTKVGLVYRRPLESTPATYALLQSAWVGHFNVGVGTRVRVVRIPLLGELGWSDGVAQEMTRYVGLTLEVVGLDDKGVRLKRPCGQGGYWFPFHVLAVVPTPREEVEIHGTTASVVRDGFLVRDEELPSQPAAEGEGFISVPLSPREHDVVLQLADKMGFKEPWRVLIQGLRQYQCVTEGSHRLVEVNPMPMMAPGLPPAPEPAGGGDASIDDILAALDRGYRAACDGIWSTAGWSDVSAARDTILESISTAVVELRQLKARTNRLSVDLTTLRSAADAVATEWSAYVSQPGLPQMPVGLFAALTRLASLSPKTDVKGGSL